MYLCAFYYVSVYFALEISEVARGLGKWARCSYPLMRNFWEGRKHGAVSSESDPDSVPATPCQRESLFPEQSCKGQGPFPLHSCEHLEPTAWAGVWPCSLGPRCRPDIPERQSSGLCGSHAAPSGPRPEELLSLGGHQGRWQMCGTLPRCHREGAWREPGGSRVDPAHSQLSITANRTPAVQEREQNEPRFPHSAALKSSLGRRAARTRAQEPNLNSKGRCDLSLPVTVRCSLPAQMSRDAGCPQMINFDPVVEILTENKGRLTLHMIKYSSNNKYISLLFQILFPYRLLQDIAYIFLCYTVGPCWLSILYTVVCIC